MHKKSVSYILLIIMVLLLAGCSGSGQQSSVTSEKKLISIGSQPGQSAPDFSLLDEKDEAVKLSQMRGKIVVINFFATWCGPCRSEMADLENFYRTKNADVLFYGVNLKESKDVIMELMQANRYTFPVLRDTFGEVAGKYQVRAIPTTYIVNKQGVISEKKVGPVTADELKRMVEAAGR